MLVFYLFAVSLSSIAFRPPPLQCYSCMYSRSCCLGSTCSQEKPRVSIYLCNDMVLGWHGSASLCRDMMARKQNGGYNASISVLTPIFHLVVNSTRLKTVRSAHWCCPNSTMAPRLLGNVVKVTKLEVVKIEFRHLASFFLSSPASLAP